MGNEIIESKKIFIRCEQCGKKIIERLPNGVWHFVFGKKVKNSSFIPVNIYIQGSLKIQCLRKNCGHWNILNYLPFSNPPKDGNGVR